MGASYANLHSYYNTFIMGPYGIPITLLWVHLTPIYVVICSQLLWVLMGAHGCYCPRIPRRRTHMRIYRKFIPIITIQILQCNRSLIYFIILNIRLHYHITNLCNQGRSRTSLATHRLAIWVLAGDLKIPHNVSNCSPGEQIAVNQVSLINWFLYTGL